MSQADSVVTARKLIHDALLAARYEGPPDEALTKAVSEGLDLPLERFGFDSLAWMEFCISIEANSGLELTPDCVETMRSSAEVQDWIAARLSA